MLLEQMFGVIMFNLGEPWWTNVPGYCPAALLLSADWLPKVCVCIFVACWFYSMFYPHVGQVTQNLLKWCNYCSWMIQLDPTWKWMKSDLHVWWANYLSHDFHFRPVRPRFGPLHSPGCWSRASCWAENCSGVLWATTCHGKISENIKNIGQKYCETYDYRPIAMASWMFMSQRPTGLSASIGFLDLRSVVSNQAVFGRSNKFLSHKQSKHVHKLNLIIKIFKDVFSWFF